MALRRAGWLVAYVALFGIALYHNEGAAGLAFRLTLGVMLLNASFEAGLLASVKGQKQAEEDILKDWRVKRYARKLARQSAMADLDLTVRMRQLDREAQEGLYTLKRQSETQLQVRMIESGVPFDISKPVEMAKFDTSTLIQANRMRKLSKHEAKQRALQLLAVIRAQARQKSLSRLGGPGRLCMTISRSLKRRAESARMEPVR